jgi:GNAT superfamily N-acetyltransferase
MADQETAADRPSIALAEPSEAHLVSEILVEAATWVDQRGVPMWKLDELKPERISAEVAQGLFALAWVEGEAAGTIRFELEDHLFWPDVPNGEAVYVHRLAVKRRFAGGTVSSALLEWAVQQVRALGRPFLRLDCDASRARLRAVYERFGFRYHSERRVGPYVVARYGCGSAGSAWAKGRSSSWAPQHTRTTRPRLGTPC